MKLTHSLRLAAVGVAVSSSVWPEIVERLERLHDRWVKEVQKQ
jgi:hypothetical protein